MSLGLQSKGARGLGTKVPATFPRSILSAAAIQHAHRTDEQQTCPFNCAGSVSLGMGPGFRWIAALVPPLRHRRNGRIRCLRPSPNGRAGAKFSSLPKLAQRFGSAIPAARLRLPSRDRQPKRPHGAFPPPTETEFRHCPIRSQSAALPLGTREKLFERLVAVRAGGEHTERFHLDLLAAMITRTSLALGHPHNLLGKVGDSQRHSDAQSDKPLKRQLRLSFH
jgi:hypothetical protein